MIKRYHHGPVAIHADPDFEESPDGDVVLWADHEADRAALVKERDEAEKAYREHAAESHRRGYELETVRRDRDVVSTSLRAARRDWEAEVALLTEKLAAAERDASVAGKMARDLKVAEQKLAAAEDRVRHECSVSRAAEARCRELEVQERNAGKLAVAHFERAKELESELAQLRAQLPDGMHHCTIRFHECELGHGRLVATNWIDHGCQTCELAQLRERVRKAQTLLNRGGCLADVHALEALRGPSPIASVTHIECQLCGDPLDDDHPKGPCVPCHEVPDGQ